MKTNENLNPSQVKTTRSVVRPVVAKGSTYELSSYSEVILLDDGNSIKEFSSATNCRFFPNCNKLLRVSYYGSNGINVIDGYDLPSLAEVVNYYGFELQKFEHEELRPWAVPLQKIASPSLIELTKVFRHIWVSFEKFDPYGREISISRPNPKVELHNIILALNDLRLTDIQERDEMLVGAYLFCMFKTVHLRDGRVSDFDKEVLGAVNQALSEIEGRNRHLAGRMQNYITLASASIFDDLSGYPTQALLVRDLFEYFHP
ncbi:MAG: hypothetical protein ABNH21_19060 [Glaciecola sp.]|jgi:hypothetical protein